MSVGLPSRNPGLTAWHEADVRAQNGISARTRRADAAKRAREATDAEKQAAADNIKQLRQDFYDRHPHLRPA